MFLIASQNPTNFLEMRLSTYIYRLNEISEYTQAAKYSIIILLEYIKNDKS